MKLRKYYNLCHFQGNMAGKFYLKASYVNENNELDDTRGRLSAMGSH